MTHGDEAPCPHGHRQSRQVRRPGDPPGPRLGLIVAGSVTVGLVTGQIHWWSQHDVGPAVHAGVMTFLGSLGTLLTAVNFVDAQRR